MARRAGKNRLTEEMIVSPLKDGYHGDGNKLFLRVTSGGERRTWSFRYKSPITGSQRDYSIGELAAFSLSEAREIAKDLLRKVELGIDPADLRLPKEMRSTSDARAMTTFEDAARAFINFKKPEWKDRKGVKQRINALNNHIFDHIGAMPIQQIGKDQIVNALMPIWEAMPPTSQKLRRLIEEIFYYAEAQGWRSGDNPAQMQKLKYHLPDLKPILQRKSKHHYALPARVMPEVMVVLEKKKGWSPVLVRFLILTAGRSIEIREAVWEEIDLEAAVWTIPKERMKKPREHRVPLCPEAIKILQAVGENEVRRGLIFRNQRGNPFSDTALSKVLKEASNDPKATIHGLRSTFWDWAEEEEEEEAASFHSIKAALAHSSARSASDAAYFRSDLLKKRRKLMSAWERFCLGKS